MYYKKETQIRILSNFIKISQIKTQTILKLGEKIGKGFHNEFRVFQQSHGVPTQFDFG